MTENVYAEVELIDLKTYIRSQENLAPTDSKHSNQKATDEERCMNMYSTPDNVAGAARDSCYIVMNTCQSNVDVGQLEDRKHSNEKVTKKVRCLWLCCSLVLVVSVVASLIAITAVGVFIRSYLSNMETQELLTKVSTDVANSTDITNMLSFKLNSFEKSLKDLNSSLSTQLMGEMQNYLLKLNDTEGSIMSRLAGLEAGLAGLNQSFTDQLKPVAYDCSQIHSLNRYAPTDYYNIRLANGSSIRLFCNMSFTCGGIQGGWTKIADFDVDRAGTYCPDELVPRNDSGIRSCGLSNQAENCASVTYPTHNIGYSKICGRTLAYQVGSVDGFGSHNRTLDDVYVDGISLTYGSHPRNHIWTFVAAPRQTNLRNLNNTCKCMRANSTGIRDPPAYIGQDYFCDAGAFESVSKTQLYGENPLWDGAGCSNTSTCCSFRNPPWFFKQLPLQVTDDLELRVCSNEVRTNEDIALSQVEIFIQ